MKVRRIIFTAAIVLLSCAAFVLRRPPMPADWQQLRSGMARAGVLALVGPGTSDMRSEKGFESAYAETSLAGMASYWRVCLRYDDAERLISADASFINRECGLFNTGEKPLLR